jgi:hypothetical protein
MMYYGGFRGLGTLYWENVDGLKEAAAIYGARSDEQAKALIDKDHITHIVIYQWDAFAEEYARLGAGLDKPKDDTERKAQDAALNQSFILKILTQHKLPNWLRPIPYQMPEHPWLKNSYVMILEVVPPQTRDEYTLHLAEWLMSLKNKSSQDAAMAWLESIRVPSTEYLPALVEQTQGQLINNQTSDFHAVMQLIDRVLNRADILDLDDRVDLCCALEADHQTDNLNQQIHLCMDSATEKGLREMTFEQLGNFVRLVAPVPNRTSAEEKSLALAIHLLPAPILEQALKMPTKLIIPKP